MQVKIDLNSFNGHAELSGQELDQLTKILVKFFGTDQRYLDGRYINVRTGAKLLAKLEISTDVEFMSEPAYKLEKEQSDAKAAALAEEQRLKRADLVAEIIGMDGSFSREVYAKLDELLGASQSLLYWRERLDRNPFVGPYVTVDGVYFYVGENNAQRITLGLDGSFKREEV